MSAAAKRRPASWRDMEQTAERTHRQQLIRRREQAPKGPAAGGRFKTHGKLLSLHRLSPARKQAHSSYCWFFCYLAFTGHLLRLCCWFSFC